MWDFPSAPTLAQTFNPIPGVVYTWNGVAWVIAASAAALVIEKLVPEYLVAGGSDVAVRVTGVGFATSSVIHLDGVAAVTTFVSTEELRATMLASVEVGPRIVQVTVRNNTIESNALPFNYVATPTLTSVTSPSISVSGPALDVTCVGTGFVNGSLVYLNFGVLPTTYVSATQLIATVSPNMGTPGDSLYIQVYSGQIITSNQLLFGFTA